MDYMVAAYTDAGIKHSVNQDSICVRRAVVPEGGELLMAVLCDGMGGMKKGEVASAACVIDFGEWFDRNLNNFHVLCGNDFALAKREWSTILEALHQRLRAYGEETQAQMGTTVVAMLTYKDRYLTVTVGDSRIYERKRELIQLTQDQSLVAREIARGRITPEEARHHPQRNVLLQCLGAGNVVKPVFTQGKIQSEALYLLCSDGLVHEVSPKELDDRLQPVCFNAKDSLTATMFEITELCKERGETDNITSILIKAVESRVEKKASKMKKRLKKLCFWNRDDDFLHTGARVVETAQIVHAQERVI